MMSPFDDSMYLDWLKRTTQYNVPPSIESLLNDYYRRIKENTPSVELPVVLVMRSGILEALHRIMTIDKEGRVLIGGEWVRAIANNAVPETVNENARESSIWIVPLSRADGPFY